MKERHIELHAERNNNRNGTTEKPFSNACRNLRESANFVGFFVEVELVMEGKMSEREEQWKRERVNKQKSTHENISHRCNIGWWWPIFPTNFHGSCVGICVCVFVRFVCRIDTVYTASAATNNWKAYWEKYYLSRVGQIKRRSTSQSSSSTSKILQYCS